MFCTKKKMRDSEIRILQKQVIIGTAFFFVLFIVSFSFFMSYKKTVEEPDAQMNIPNIQQQSVVGISVFFGIALSVLVVIFIYTSIKLNYS